MKNALRRYLGLVVPSILSGLIVSLLTLWYVEQEKPKYNINADVQVIYFNNQFSDLINSLFAKAFSSYLADEVQSDPGIEKLKSKKLLDGDGKWSVLERAYVESFEKDARVNLLIEVREADLFIVQRNDETAELIETGKYQREIILAPNDELAVYALRFGAFVTRLDAYQRNIRISVDDIYLPTGQFDPVFAKAIGWLTNSSPFVMFLLIEFGLFFLVFTVIALVLDLFFRKSAF